MLTGAEKRQAQALYDDGFRLLRDGRHREAVSSYEAALGIDPDHPAILLALGNAQLLVGDDANGWRNYGQRPQRRQSQANSLPFPEWAGQSLAGKRLFIWPEQGLGDQIFAARYVRGLGAAHVVMHTLPPLVDLFAQLPVEIRSRRFPCRVETTFDYWVQPLTLPRWVAPEPSPYLSARPRATGARLGVMWRGNAVPDPARSIPDQIAASLLSIPGAMSLQPEDTGARNLRDTAEIIAGLEHVISIDTSVAHLAGAMGKPGTILLKHDCCDWRWRERLPGRSDWYPTLRLLRQPSPGDWRGLVDYLIVNRNMTTRPAPPAVGPTATAPDPPPFAPPSAPLAPAEPSPPNSAA